MPFRGPREEHRPSRQRVRHRGHRRRVPVARWPTTACTTTRSSGRWAAGYGSSTSPIPRTHTRPARTPTRAGRTTSRCAAISRSSASIRSAAIEPLDVDLPPGQGGDRRRRHRASELRPRDRQLHDALIDCVSASPERRRPQLDDPSERRVARDGQPAHARLGRRRRPASRPAERASTASSRAGSLAQCQPARARRPASASRTGVPERGARTTSPSRRTANTMYVAAVGNDTVIVDVSERPRGDGPTIGVAPNDSPPTATSPRTATTSRSRTSPTSEPTERSSSSRTSAAAAPADELQHRSRTESSAACTSGRSRLSASLHPPARRRRARSGSAAGSTRTRGCWPIR